MDWSQAHSSPRQQSTPTLDLLENCWRLRAPSGKVLECGVYRTAAGLEVRCQYRETDLLRSQFAVEIGTAREVAEAWRQAVLAKAGFEELNVGA